MGSQAGEGSPGLLSQERKPRPSTPPITFWCQTMSVCDGRGCALTGIRSSRLGEEGLEARSARRQGPELPNITVAFHWREQPLHRWGGPLGAGTLALGSPRRRAALQVQEPLQPVLIVPCLSGHLVASPVFRALNPPAERSKEALLL